MTDDWRLIEDEDVPRDGSWFVIWGPHQKIPVAGCAKMDVEFEEAEQGGMYRRGVKQARPTHWVGFDNVLYCYATHWMPLKPPGETGA